MKQIRSLIPIIYIHVSFNRNLSAFLGIHYIQYTLKIELVTSVSAILTISMENIKY